jgi:hypothetical protein
MKTIQNKTLERIYRKEAVEKVFNSLDYQSLLSFSTSSVGLSPKTCF